MKGKDSCIVCGIPLIIKNQYGTCSQCTKIVEEKIAKVKAGVQSGPRAKVRVALRK